jgi:hypothetical protein
MRKSLIFILAGIISLSACESSKKNVEISGELKQWHKVTLTLDGPQASETDTAPNPFTDYSMTVTFTHESGEPEYAVPGYFAADGNAAETSAESGNKWRAHLSPDKEGIWNYRINFTLNGKVTKWDDIAGEFEVADSDKSGRDFRAKGRLNYVNQRYLQFAESGEFFLKAGADAPETLLAYADFDSTYSLKKSGIKRQGEAITSNLKSWEPHIRDWKEGDPTWQNGKGKGLIGAINYLASTGCNAFSFLTYNAGGDGDNVWPHVSHDNKLHFDCSKLDQWGIVFDHATSKGMYLHFKLQETENDDNTHRRKDTVIHALDAGELGIQRKLYLRELIARYGHNLALNWNLGEENTQTTTQVLDMSNYIRETDPYNHNIVLHTYPNQQDKIYNPLLGNREALTGLSIQNSDVSDTHREAVKWVKKSEESGHPWVVAHDEPGSAAIGTPPDPDYPGTEEAKISFRQDRPEIKIPSIDEIRSEVLWGNLMAGGTGVEYYFGYRMPENDLDAEDWRSREKTWSYSSIALKFFTENEIPFPEMISSDELVGNPENNNTAYCFSKPGEIYLVYYPSGNSPELNLKNENGTFKVKWFNPRTGGELSTGSVQEVSGNTTVDLGNPPVNDDRDWVILVSKAE